MPLAAPRTGCARLPRAHDQFVITAASTCPTGSSLQYGSSNRESARKIVALSLGVLIALPTACLTAISAGCIRKYRDLSLLISPASSFLSSIPRRRLGFNRWIGSAIEPRWIEFVLCHIKGTNGERTAYLLMLGFKVGTAASTKRFPLGTIPVEALVISLRESTRMKST